MSAGGTRRSVATTRLRAVRGGTARDRADALVVEEPLEIRAAGPGQAPVRVAVTMRTPGDDFELAAGFLVSEGLAARHGIAAVTYCDEPDAQRFNVVTVRTRHPFDLGAAERHFFATSSCGICGKAALEAIAVRCEPLAPADGAVVDGTTIMTLPGMLLARQRIFGRTGGLHAAGLFTAGGALTLLREDVGRHNAVDKVVGARELATAPAEGDVLLVSGRLSFEIVQKAAVAGIPVVCAISAATSLAVDAADRLGITAVGFLRPDGYNVYTHPRRIRAAG